LEPLFPRQTDSAAAILHAKTSKKAASQTINTTYSKTAS
jgi:hypothetical protein